MTIPVRWWEFQRKGDVVEVYGTFHFPFPRQLHRIHFFLPFQDIQQVHHAKHLHTILFRLRPSHKAILRLSRREKKHLKWLQNNDAEADAYISDEYAYDLEALFQRMEYYWQKGEGPEQCELIPQKTSSFPLTAMALSLLMALLPLSLDSPFWGASYWVAFWLLAFFFALMAFLFQGMAERFVFLHKKGVGVVSRCTLDCPHRVRQLVFRTSLKNIQRVGFVDYPHFHAVGFQFYSHEPADLEIAPVMRQRIDDHYQTYRMDVILPVEARDELEKLRQVAQLWEES